MFQLQSLTEVRVTSVTNRVERHGEDEQPAVSLGLELTDANTSLDLIDPKIREALYKAVEGQDQLPGVEPATPVLRCNAFDRHTLATAYEGWTLSVDDGVDESKPMVFGGCKIDKFSVEAKQGGSVVLRFRAGTSDVDAEKLGKIAMHNGQSIWITLSAPKPGDEPIDGTTEAFRKDHPDATDLFTAGGADDPDGADSEGGDPDVEAGGDDEGAPQDLEDRLDGALAKADDSWPFPRGEVPSEAPPQSVTTERTTRSPAGSRTARGRAATAKALAAGAPKA